MAQRGRPKITKEVSFYILRGIVDIVAIRRIR